ncbi:sporulation protein YqfD [Paenibacillus albicereus]|uniref:Sporulation protein YqfD n=1 Tax=Paenibacillus albicereus TaxID=2726185 RepID=A0A6H2GYN9_9BACL|nr:sporulation protein YqfD [Paenibacillus albicereus]QJC52553.1 sporulation protein YqfD [Paenibacillus albicereus]
MKVGWLQRAKGIVTVQVRGGEPEALVNGALEDGLSLWSIRRTSPEHMVFSLTVPDFFRLRPYLRRTGCRVHVTQREGLPFWLRKAGKRKFFLGGVVLFFTAMYLLSSLLWNIEVRGNKTIRTEDLLAAAKAEGVHPFQWEWKLPEPSDLAKRLSQRLPDAAWIGVEKKGTRLIIQVVETKKPQARALRSTRHLIASADAVVTRIIADKGRPVVHVNSRVKKGQTLISGTIGEGSNTATVVADGEVRGLVWYEYNVVSPLVRTVNVYTGETKTKWSLVLFGKAFQVSGYGKDSFATSQTREQLQQLGWRGWELPVGRLKETVMELRQDRRQLGREEAVESGLLQARADVLSKAGADAVVKEQKILHEKTDNGKVYLKVLLEVDQSIVKEMPLVQMQGE